MLEVGATDVYWTVLVRNAAGHSSLSLCLRPLQLLVFLLTEIWIRDSSVDVSADLRAGRPGFNSWQRPDRLWGPSNLLSNGHLYTDFHLVPRSRMVKLYLQSPIRLQNLVFKMNHMNKCIYLFMNYLMTRSASLLVYLCMLLNDTISSLLVYLFIYLFGAS
jgi:hypothetical protein